MTKITVGHIYYDPDDGDVIVLKYIEGDKCYLDVLEDPESCWVIAKGNWMHLRVFKRMYRKCPVRNTEMGRAIYGN